MSTNMLNIPNGMVLVPVQLQSGTGFVPVQIQSGGSESVPVQIQSSGSESVPGSSPDTKLLEFKRSSPQVLGAVQIMVGLLIILLDATLTWSGNLSTLYLGAVAWAPLCYIIAGSLTVAADRLMSHCMINGSMGMNVVTAVLSCVATILYALDTYWNNKHNWNETNWNPMWIQSVLSFLVFNISISVSVFGCKATCCCKQTLILQAVVIGNHLPAVSTVMSLATPSPYAPPSYTELGHMHLPDGDSLIPESHPTGPQWNNKLQAF